MGSNAIGEIPILITGDYSGLIADLQIAENLAAQGATAIGGSFTTAARGSLDLDEAIRLLTADGMEFDDTVKNTSQGVTSFGEVLKSVADSAAKVAPPLQQIAPAAKAAEDQTNNLTAALKAFGNTTVDAKTGSDNLLSSLLQFAGIALTFQGIKTAVTEAFDSFARVERATESLTALTGSSVQAQTEITKLRVLANDEALSFPSLLKADQQMHALGLTTQQIIPLLKGAADAGVATGRGFDTTSAALERLVEGGMAGSRQLLQVGLVSKDLANVLGVTTDQVTKLFKGLDESARAEVATEALKKFKDLAEKTANDTAGSWQKLRNVADQEFTAIGAAIAPAATELIKFAADTARELSSVVQHFEAAGHAFGLLGANVLETLAALAIAVRGNPMAALGLEIIQLGLSWRGYADAATGAEKASQTVEDKLRGLASTTREVFNGNSDFIAQLNGMAAALERGGIKGDEFNRLVRNLVAEFRELNPIAAAASTATNSLVKDLDALQARFHATGMSQSQYQAEILKTIAAHSEATKAVKSHVLSLGELEAKNSQLNAELKVAQSVYDAATKAMEDGTGKANLQSEALKQLTAAHKALNDVELDSQTINKITEEKADSLIQKTLAQVVATQQMIDEWGLDDLAVQESVRARDALLQKMGATREEIQNLIPIFQEAAANGDQLNIRIETLAGAFSKVGIKSAEVLKQIAEDMKAAAESIIGDSTKLSAQGIAAWNKWQDAAKQAADAVSIVQTNAHAMGITTVQDLTYMRDKYIAMIDEMRQSGEGGWDAIRAAEQKVKELNDKILESTSPLIDAYKKLGIESTDALKKDLDQKQAALEIIRQMGSGLGELEKAQEAVNKATQKYTDSLYGATTAHQGLNTIAAQLPPILNADVTTLEKINSLIVEAGQSTQRWGAFMESVAAAAKASAESFASFDAAAQANDQSIGGKIGSFDVYDPHHPEKGGYTFSYGSAGAGAGGAGLVGTWHEPYNPNGGPSSGMKLNANGTGYIPDTAGASSGASSGPSSASAGATVPTLLDSGLVQDTNVKIRQTFEDMAAAGEVNVGQLNAMATAIGEFVTVDASGLHIAWQSLTTATQPLTTAATAATTAFNSFTTTTTPAVQSLTSTVAAAVPQIAAFSRTIADATALQQAQNAITVPPVSLPGYSRLGNVTTTSVISPSTNITFNNLQVRSQSDIDGIAAALKNLGVT